MYAREKEDSEADDIIWKNQKSTWRNTTIEMSRILGVMCNVKFSSLLRNSL